MSQPGNQHPFRTALSRLVVATFAVAASSVSTASATTISVGPYTPSASTAFVVPIVVHDAVDLASFAFDLAYDPTVFQIDTACDPLSDAACDLFTGPVTQGTFYTASAIFPTLFVPGFIALDAMGDQIGELLGVSGAWQDPGAAPSGDGVLAYVEFTMLAGSTTTTPIMVVGSPSTPVGSVPEPSTVALLFGALAFVGARLRKGVDRDADRGHELPRTAAA